MSDLEALLAIRRLRDSQALELRELKLMIQNIVQYTHERGLNVTIELRPLQPLAMGHTEPVVEVWAKRIPS